MPDRIQRNRTTGEYRVLTENGWQPYMPTREDEARQAAEQEAKFASGEIRTAPSWKDYAGNVAAQYTPEALGMLGGAAGALVSPVIGTGVGTAAGHVAGDVMQRLAHALGIKNTEERPDLTTELEQAGLAGLGGAAVGGAFKVGGKVLKAAPALAEHLPYVGKYVRTARELAGLLPKPKVAGVGAAGEEVPDTLRYRFNQAKEVPYRAEPSRPPSTSQGGYPAPSTNPLSEVLEPPNPDAWTALNSLRQQTHEVGANPVMGSRVSRAAEAGVRNPSLDQAVRQMTSEALPDEIGQVATRAAGGETAPAFTFEGSSTGIPHDVGTPGLTIGDEAAQFRLSQPPRQSSLAGLEPESVSPPEPYAGSGRGYGYTPVDPSAEVERLPDQLRQLILDLDQRYQGHTFGARTPYRPQ